MFADDNRGLPDAANDRMWQTSFEDIRNHLAHTVPALQSLQNLIATDTAHLRPNDFLLLYTDGNIFIYFYGTQEMAVLRTPPFGIAPAKSRLPANTGIFVLQPIAFAYFRELALSNPLFTFDDRTTLKRSADGMTEGAQQNWGSFEAALSTQATVKATRAQTPAARSLHKNTAASLSMTPDQVISTGIFNTYQQILHPTFYGLQQHNWSLTGPVLSQLQPGHILDLVSNWSALSLDLFASLDDQYGAVMAKTKAAVFARIVTVEVDNTIAVDTSIIGADVNRFGKALRNYGYVLDTIFMFKPVIQQALLQLFHRLVTFVSPRMYGADDSRSTALLEYAGRHVMIELQRVYGSAFASSSMEIPDTFIVQCINEIPDTHNNSEFSIAIGHIHMSMAAIKTSTKVPQPPGLSNRATKKQKKIEAEAKRAAEKVTAAAPSKTTKGVCGYFLSATGCKNASCTREHRIATPAEQPGVLQFFTRNKKLTQTKF